MRGVDSVRCSAGSGSESCPPVFTPARPASLPRLQIDRFCLEQGKRCIMWDDEGAGFYLVGAAPKPPLASAQQPDRQPRAAKTPHGPSTNRKHPTSTERTVTHALMAPQALHWPTPTQAVRKH